MGEFVWQLIAAVLWAGIARDWAMALDMPADVALRILDARHELDNPAKADRDDSPRWEHAAELASYPSTDASALPAIAAGQVFVVDLPEPELIYGLRIVGRPGGDFVSCAELSAFTA